MRLWYSFSQNINLITNVCCHKLLGLTANITLGVTNDKKVISYHGNESGTVSCIVLHAQTLSHKQLIDCLWLLCTECQDINSTAIVDHQKHSCFVRYHLQYTGELAIIL